MRNQQAQGVTHPEHIIFDISDISALLTYWVGLLESPGETGFKHPMKTCRCPRNVVTFSEIRNGEEPQILFFGSRSQNPALT